MIYEVANLPEKLSNVIETVFYLGGYRPEHNIERVVPSSKINLIIEMDGFRRHVFDPFSLEPMQMCERAWISGMHTSCFSISALQNSELLVVQFADGGCPSIFHQSAYDFLNRVVPAEHSLGNEILDMRNKAKDTPEWKEKFRLLLNWLLKRFDPSFVAKPYISETVELIRKEPSLRSLERIFDEIPISRKHFIDQFKFYIGVTPKRFQRILRFLSTIPEVNQMDAKNWADLSVDCGYSDQAHFIRDFKSFSGFLPECFLGKGFERTNFFPE